MLTQQRARDRLLRAEAAFGQAVAQIEAFWTVYGHAGSPLRQQMLEREYRRRRTTLRAARTQYGTLAKQYGWTLP